MENEDIQIKHDRISQNITDALKKKKKAGITERVVEGVNFVLSVQGRASN